MAYLAISLAIVSLVVFQTFAFIEEKGMTESGLKYERLIRGPRDGNVIKFGRTNASFGFELPYSTEQDSYITWVVDYINNNGGIDVGGVNYMIQDIVYNVAPIAPGDCLEIAIFSEWLITVDKVDVLLTGVTTGCNGTSAMAEVYGVPCINNGNYGYFFTYPDGLNWTVVATSNPAGSAQPCIQAFCEAGAKSAVVVATDSQYPSFNYSLLYAVETTCPDMKLYFFDDLNPDSYLANDYLDYMEPYIKKWQSVNPDLIVGGLGPEQGAYNFFNSLRHFKFNPKGYYGWSDLSFPETRTLVDWLAYGGTSASNWDPSFNFTDPYFGSTANFVDLYTKDFESSPSDYAAANIMAVILAAKAIQNAGTLDKDAVIRALYEFNESTLYGVIQFNQTNGYLNFPNYCFQFQGENKYGVVTDPAFGFGSLIYPWNFEYVGNYLQQLIKYTYAFRHRKAIIAGSVLGAVALVAVVVGAIILFRRYHIFFIKDSGLSKTGSDW